MTVPIQFVTWDDDGEMYVLATARVLGVPRKGDTIHLRNLVARSALEHLGTTAPTDNNVPHEDVAFIVSEVVWEFDASPERPLALPDAIRIELSLPAEDRRWDGANRGGSHD